MVRLLCDSLLTSVVMVLFINILKIMYLLWKNCGIATWYDMKSCANRVQSKSITIGRSFKCNINCNGPKILPYGTPAPFT